jgi:hypothetical protein
MSGASHLLHIEHVVTLAPRQGQTQQNGKQRSLAIDLRLLVSFAIGRLEQAIGMTVSYPREPCRGAEHPSLPRVQIVG